MLRQKVHEILEGHTRLGKWVNGVIMVAIVLSFVSVVLETYGALEKDYAEPFYAAEVFFIAIFTAEYVLRLWSCTADPAYARPFAGRLRYAIGFFSVIDLIAILPFYLVFIFHGVDLRGLRLFRLLRIFKLMRHFHGANLLLDVLRRKRQELLVSLMLVVILLLVSSTLIYVAEHDAQPKVFSSIVVTMWWAIETLSTVGYGDMAPVTFFGRLLGGLIALLGIGMFALPAGILAQGLAEAIHHRNQSQQAAAQPDASRTVALKFCPHCGERLPVMPED